MAKYTPKKTKISTLKDLIEVLSKAKTPCKYAFSDGMLKSFAFHSIKQDQVAVRIALSHSCESDRGKTTEFGLLLPIPDPLKKPLTLATAGEAGFLMEKAKRIFGDKEIHLFADKQ